jgi:SNF2 family DNA or RNA helicase
MLGYQTRALGFAKEKKFAYLALDMGMGKTRVALEWCEQPTLVFAPLRSVLTTWPEETEKWIAEPSYSILHGSGRQFGKPTQLYFINYEGADWLFSELKAMYAAKKPMPFKRIIFDEAHMLKSHNTNRFKALKQIRDLATDGIICLSGSPTPQSAMDLWSQIYLLDRGKRLGKNITAFRNMYCERSPYCVHVWKIKSPEHERMIWEKVDDIMFRLDARDYLDLPDKVEIPIEINLPKPVLAQARTLERTMMLELDEDTVVTAPFAAARSNKLRQVIQGGIYINPEHDYRELHTQKLEALESLVDSANGQGIICAIQYKFELDMIKKLYPKVATVTGSSKIRDFKSLVDAWNRKEIPLIVCHPKSLSSSVNLQAGSHILVWYAIPWSVEQHDQLIARLLRMGQLHKVFVYYLIAKGTIDVRVVKALKLKISNQRDFLNYLRQTTEVL